LPPGVLCPVDVDAAGDACPQPCGKNAICCPEGKSCCGDKCINANIVCPL